MRQWLTQAAVPLALCAAAVALAGGYASRSYAQRGGASALARRLAPPPEFEPEEEAAFVENALDLLGPGGPGAALPVASNDGGATSPGGEEAAPVAAGAWSQFISAASLEDEVKRLAGVLAAATSTPSEFKGGGYEVCRRGFSTLAVVYQIIGQFDGDVRWKAQGVGLRAMFARAGFNCKTSTDNSFKESKLRAEDLAELIRGGSVEMPEAEPALPWNDVANRPPLMQRMEEGLRETLPAWVSSKSDFAGNYDAVLREVELLALFSEVIKDASYEYGDDASYLEYANQFQAAMQDMLQAARDKDQEKTQAAMGRVNQACDACHGDFRS